MRFRTNVIIIIIFIVYGLFLCLKNILPNPFLEFDEAHRAESAKQMLQHKEFLVPIDGSPFLQNQDLKLLIRKSPPGYLYYHLERPPLVYWLMMASITVFSENRIFFALPSLITGISAFGIFFLIIKKIDIKAEKNALIVSLLSLLTAYDWWYISQMAQLDTVNAAFILLSLAGLLLFIKDKNNKSLIFSGIFLGLAILSKGQPAGIMAFPILFLTITRELSFKKLFYLLIPATIIVSAWIIPTGMKFGFNNVFFTFFLNFVHGRLMHEDITQQAPFYWYTRWWIDTLRPGLNLFILFFIIDVIKKNFEKKQLVLLSFIFCSFILESLSVNKVWWYVIPLIPAISLYIYLSGAHHLRQKTFSVFQLALATTASSLPLVFQSTNKEAFAYAAAILSISLFILFYKKLQIKGEYFITISLILSLLFFLLHFPRPKAIYPKTREAAEFFKSLTGNKCLYVRNMPYESALYYSNSGAIEFLKPETKLSKRCKNYLLTPDKLSNFKRIFTSGNIYLYQL